MNAPRPPGEPLSILLVEDDQAHAEIARRNLRDSRIPNRIQHVEDGQEALDYLFRQGRYADPATSPRPDVILLDLRLPRVEGVEVLRRIKEERNLRTIPVVVLTTSATSADMLLAYQNHASSYLVKPGDFEDYAGLLQGFSSYWLGLNRYLG